MDSIAILFSYPTWFLLVCATLAGFLSWLLYRKPLFGEEDRLWLRRLLGGLRFVFLFVVLSFLLEPLIRHSVRVVEKPVIALLIDNSASILMQPDSAQTPEAIATVQRLLNERLGDAHEVRTYLMDDGVREESLPVYTAPVSNLSKAIKSLDDQYENRNLGAVVLLSDGIYNQGNNPVYQKRKVSSPLYTLALGDTARKRDLVLDEVRHNRLSYLGNEFPLVAVLKAQDLQDRETVLKVRQGNKVLYEKRIRIEAGQWQVTEEIKLKAAAAGMQRYTLSLEPVEGEFTVLNNSKTVYIDVIDARNKVLLLAHAPHPDLAALRQAITSNENYQVILEYARDYRPGSLEDINLIILHQLPSLAYPSTQLLEQAAQKNIPLFFIVGQQTAVNWLGQWTRGLGMTRNLPQPNDALPHVSEGFQLFQLDELTFRAIRSFPPLNTPFGKYQEVNPASVLLYQKLGSIATEDPLLAFAGGGEQKTGVLYGDGYWRWRLYDFDQNGNHNASDELMNKIVQYLSARKDNRPFRAEPAKRRFDENERIRFRAELYNEAFEPVNEPDVSLSLKDEAGKEYTFRFVRDRQAYSLDAGFLPAGDYTYVAGTNYLGRQLLSNGLISIRPLELEALNTRADHTLLQQLAEQNNGKMYPLDAAEQLIDALEANEQIHAVSYMQNSLDDLIRQKWIFWLILVLISTEWFIRKYKGAY